MLISLPYVVYGSVWMFLVRIAHNSVVDCRLCFGEIRSFFIVYSPELSETNCQFSKVVVI